MYQYRNNSNKANKTTTYKNKQANKKVSHINEKLLFQNKYPVLNHHNSQVNAPLLQQGQHYYRYDTDLFSLHLP